MTTLESCIVLLGPELTPTWCDRFCWEGERIVEIQGFRPVTTMDRPTLVILPGLMNGHTHLGDSLLPEGATGLSLEAGFFRPDGYKYRALREATEEALRESMEASLRAMASGGTIGHIDFREQGWAGAKMLRDVSDKVGLASIILSQFENPPFNEEQLLANQLELDPAWVQELDEILNISDGFSESTINDLTDPAWRQIHHVTEDWNCYRAIHCLENDGYRQTSMDRTGKGDLQRALEVFQPHLVVHMTVATDREIQELKSSGTACVVNPRANLTLGLPVPPLRKLLEAGIPLLLGTDNAMLNAPDLFREMDTTFRLLRSQYGDPRYPDPVEVLKMATVNFGKAFPGGYRGILEEGGEATFCMVDFRQPHLRNSRHIVGSLVSRVSQEDVLCTVRKGNLLYEKQVA